MSNPDARSRDGMRAIHFAAYYGHLECIKLLVNVAKIDKDTPGAKRMTPLQMASARGYFDIVEYLLSIKANVMTKDKFRRTSVILATANGNIKILSLLLKMGGLYDLSDSS